jgi:hypothetical protein
VSNGTPYNDVLPDCDQNGWIDNCNVQHCLASCDCSVNPLGCSTCGSGRQLLDPPSGRAGCLNVIRIDNLVVREITPCDWRKGRPCDDGEECKCTSEGFTCEAVP